MRRLALLLLFAPLLHAATFRFNPPAPVNDTTTTVNYSATWSTSCPPAPTVTKTSRQILLWFAPSTSACTSVNTPFTMTVNLGVLPAGTFDVQAGTVGDPGVMVGQTTLVVRDATTFALEPYAGLVNGGSQVVIASKTPFGPEPLHVLFGGAEAQIVRRIDDSTIEVATPPHAAGAVGVTVGDRTATAAFTFYDPNAATPDPYVFTKILFPIDFAGPGAFESQWTTENWVELANGKRQLPVTGSASGVVVPVLRTDHVSANSRIRDLSRTALTAGAEIPVVREDDFSDHLRLLNIPTGANMRALLRVWTNGDAKSFDLSIDQIPSFVAQIVRLAPAQGGLRYGAFDLTPFLDSTNDHLDLSAGVANGTLMWGMVSITNNDTQQVTIVSPH